MNISTNREESSQETFPSLDGATYIQSLDKHNSITDNLSCEMVKHDIFKRNKSGRLNRLNIHTFYGTKYGKLTLIKKSDQIMISEKGHNILLADFMCDCGNMITRRASDVIGRNRSIKSCGCLVRETAIKTGQKMRTKSVNPGDLFGYVTVIEEIENSHPREILTKCICGNNKTFNLNYILSKNSHKASCGCKFNLLQKERSKKNIKNIVNVGEVYNYLTILRVDLEKVYSGEKKFRARACETKCVCGKVSIMRIDEVINGKISCGCQTGIMNGKRVSKHNLYKTSEYLIFSNMKQRCYNIKSTSYKSYGAINIKMCDRWLKPAPEGFMNFMEDLGPRPSSNHSIDRIDPNGNYEPSNCRWATTKEQGQNKRIRTCPHCGIVIKGSNYTRYHGDNCKSKSPDNYN